MKTILITLPKGFMNIAVTTDNHFIADTNNSVNWDKLKFPLPNGKWNILSTYKQDVLLVKYSWWEKMLHKLSEN